MVPNNSSLLTATKSITTDGKNNSVEYRSTKNEESNPTICGDDNQQIEDEYDNTENKRLSNDNSSDDQKEDMMSVKCENTINEDSDDRDENNCDDDCDDDDDGGESKNDELTLEQKIQRAKVTIGGGACISDIRNHSSTGTYIAPRDSYYWGSDFMF